MMGYARIVIMDIFSTTIIYSVTFRNLLIQILIIIVKLRMIAQVYASNVIIITNLRRMKMFVFLGFKTARTINLLGSVSIAKTINCWQRINFAAKVLKIVRSMVQIADAQHNAMKDML